MIIMKRKIRVSIINFILTFAFVIASTMPAYAAKGLVGTNTQPKEGYYKIKAIKDIGEGEYLYFDRKADWKYIKWNKEGSIVYISPTPNLGQGCYRISFPDEQGKYLSTHFMYGEHGDGFMLFLDGSQDPYKRIWFSVVSGTNNYSNLLISFDDYDNNYNYLRRERKLLANDYVDLWGDTKDLTGMLWALVEVNYNKSMTKAAPSLTAQKNGKVTIRWDKFRKKIQGSDIWKSAKYIEIEISTKKDFSKNVKTKKIKKGSVNKAKAKTVLSKLKKGKAYYIRVRFIDKEGVYSNWSKTVKVRTK
jgi:hypothetical protein